IDRGLRSPSSDWKVRYGLMLGLERALAAETPRTASGTTLRRQQTDALAGLLTELIAATPRSADENGNGCANGSVAELVDEAEEDEEDAEDAELREEESEEASYAEAGPGAVRRYRFRHPTASGKTIAAAGFVEAARELGVLILTH